MQIEWGASLAVIIEENILTPTSNVKLYSFIFEALESWNNAKWDVVCEHYIQHLDTIVHSEADKEAVIKKLVDLSLSLCELSQAIPSRWTGARLMSILSNIIDPETAKKKMLPKIKKLCRDFNWEVRKAIAGHISKIFELLEEDEWDKHLFDIIVELIEDEEQEVKALAIDAFLSNIDSFTQEKVEEDWVRVLADVVDNEANHELIIEKFDCFIESGETIKKFFSQEKYLKHKNVDLRNKILTNWHAYLEVLGQEDFSEMVLPYIIPLLKSEDDVVRTRLAGNLHKVIELLGTACCYDMEFDKHLSTMMNDKCKTVKGELLVWIDQIVEVMLPAEISEELLDTGINSQIENYRSTFMRHFVKMEEGVRPNWRHLNRWLDSCFRSIDGLGPANVAKKCLPVVLAQLKKGAKETRLSWIHFLCRSLTLESSDQLKEDTIDLCSSLPYATWSFTRLIYLEFINELVDFISKKYFWSTFLDAFYLLSKDKWVNVIIKFAKIAPNIFKKVNYDDTKNRDRIINILKALSESDKIKHYAKEFLQSSLIEIQGSKTLSTSDKEMRDEEEKNFYNSRIIPLA